MSGKTVEIRSQNGNATIKGSVVVSDNGTDIHGGKGVSIVNDVATFASQSHSASKKSGVMGTGGVGVSIGQLKQDSRQQSYQEQAVGSRVGITQAGDINITTDNHYQQTGSEVSIRKENEKGEAITGNISVKAKSGKVEAASQGYSTDSAYHMQQKGVTVALSIPVVEAVQAVGKAYQSAKNVGTSEDDRINALGAINAAAEAKQAAESLMKATDNLANANQSASQGVSFSLTYGQQQASQNQHSEGKQQNASGEVTMGLAPLGASGQISSLFCIPLTGYFAFFC